MERIKFEENSREKFEERELQPSAGAWNALEKMLDEAQPQKKKRGFPWLAIAASFIGFIIVASIVFNQNNNDKSIVEEDTPSEILKIENEKSPFKTEQEIIKENEAVAETENKNPAIKTESDQQTQSNVKEEASNSIATNNQNTKNGSTTNNANNNANPLQKTQQVKSNVFQKINKAPIVNAGQISALPNDKTQKENGENKEDAVKISEKLNPAIDAVVAQIKDIQNKNGTVTETEINALLATAQQDIEFQRLLDTPTGKVDAMALLGEVEMELEQTFREKVFYALGEGFEQLRTTITDRNN